MRSDYVLILVLAAMLPVLVLMHAPGRSHCYTVDRVVDGEWVVLETEPGETVDVPAGALPAGVAEGHRVCLMVTGVDA